MCCPVHSVYWEGFGPQGGGEKDPGFEWLRFLPDRARRKEKGKKNRDSRWQWLYTACWPFGEGRKRACCKKKYWPALLAVGVVPGAGGSGEDGGKKPGIILMLEFVTIVRRRGPGAVRAAGCNQFRRIPLLLHTREREKRKGGRAGVFVRLLLWLA